MTIGGWIVMLLSVTFVVSLASFCFYRVLTSPSRQSELDTQPVDT